MLPWVSWIVWILFLVTAGYLIYLMYSYAGQVFAQWADQTGLTQFMIVIVALLSLLNAGLLVYVALFSGRKLLAGEKIPLMVGAGLVFFAFLDWLLVVWFWDPGYLYGIGWQNSTSMLFMLIMYGLAAAIYFGFSAYRKRQGIDVDKVYKEIPVE
jgi:glucan phosphoethanolaminetransferase (alkaline phosphatase superfamily)